MSDQAILGLTVGIVLAYMFLRVRLVSLLQPVRLRLADTGAELLASGDISDAQKNDIEFVLGRLFSVKTAWLFAIFLLPAVLVGQYRKWRGTAVVFRPKNKALHTKLGHFHSVAMLVVASNSPIAAVLIALQIFIVFGPVGSAAMKAVHALHSGIDLASHARARQHADC